MFRAATCADRPFDRLIRLCTLSSRTLRAHESIPPNSDPRSTCGSVRLMRRATFFSRESLTCRLAFGIRMGPSLNRLHASHYLRFRPQVPVSHAVILFSRGTHCLPGCRARLRGGDAKRCARVDQDADERARNPRLGEEHRLGPVACMWPPAHPGRGVSLPHRCARGAFPMDRPARRLESASS